jgi:hypothetical protein
MLISTFIDSASVEKWATTRSETVLLHSICHDIQDSPFPETVHVGQNEYFLRWQIGR